MGFEDFSSPPVPTDCFVLWLFDMVPWAGLQYVIVVVFPDHTHFLFVQFWLRARGTL